MQYRREIDGLRAFAVLPVILFHAGFSLFSGGYVGVDVFFVISGYLITSIILRELEQGRFSILRFYERRIRRILPALFAMMAVCIPVAWVVLSPYMFRDFSQSVAAVSVYLSNVLFWLESDYFDTAAELKPLLHTWSLAVEEQYYVIVPMLLMGLWHLGRASLFAMIVLLAVASLALSQWMVEIYPSANFYLLPSRAWELLAGSICAFLLAGGKRYGVSALAWLGLGMILFAVFVFDAHTPFPSLYALLPVAGTALVILFTAPQASTARFLSWPPFVWVGLISYSAYLWHQPIFAFTRLHLVFEPSPWLMGALCLVSLGAAWISWRFIERPFRSAAPGPSESGQAKPWLASRQKLFSATAGLSALFLIFGLAPVTTHWQHQSWRALRSAETLQTHELIRRTDHRSHQAWHDEETRTEGCVFRVSLGRDVIDYDLPLDTQTRLQSCAAQYGEGLAILGDSHARDLFGAVSSASDAPFIIGFTELDCSIHDPLRRCQYDQFKQYLASHPDMFSTVLVGQAGFYLLQEAIGHESPRNLFRSLPLTYEVPDYGPNIAGVERVEEYLESLAPYAEIIWIGPRPEPHIPHEFMMREGCESHFTLRENQFGPYREMEREIATRLADSPVSFISQIDALAFDIHDDFMTCEALYWTDGDHLSQEGQARFGPRLMQALEALPQFPATGQSEVN